MYHLTLEFPERPITLSEVLSDTEKELIEIALEKSGGIKARAARLLGLHRTTLVAKMKLYDFAINKPYPRK